MGANNSVGIDKVNFENKIKFLENSINKKCTYHGKNATLYCSITGCSKCPYLCHECMKNNIHEHAQGIQERDDFIKTMIELIQTYQTKNNNNGNLFDDHDDGKDYAWAIKEQMKMMEQIQLLENEVMNIIAQYKNKLQEDLEKNMAKVNKSSKNKTDVYFKFYANPNILVNKLMSDGNNEFILGLKKKLNPAKEKAELSIQQEVAQHRNSLNLVKQNIRELLNINTISFLRNKKQLNQYTDIACSLKKTIPPISNSEYPLKIGSCGTFIVVSTNKELWQVDFFSKIKTKITTNSLNQISSHGEAFIGLINPTTILISDGKRSDKMSFITKISSLSLLKSKNNIYALLGEEEGIFTVVDIEIGKTVFHYRCGDKPLSFIEKCEKNSTILCSSSKGPLFIFKYQTKYDDYEFQYIGRHNNSIFPSGEIQLMKIEGYDLFLFGSCRNLVIFDLMLNAQVLRTQYSQRCPSFSEACFYKFGESDVLLTLSQNQNIIYSWVIDKGRKTVKVDPLSIKNNSESVILSICSNKDELWVSRDGVKQIFTYSLSI